MADPDVAPGGVWGALLTGLGAALGGLGVWLKSRRSTKSAGTQLDHIEEMLDTLVRCLVVPTEDGGKVTASRKLAEGLSARLDNIERHMARRPVQTEKLAELSGKVDRLTAAVETLLGRRT